MTTVRGRALVCSLAVVMAAAMALAADEPQSKLPLTSPSAILLVRVKGLGQLRKAFVALVTQFDADAGKELDEHMKVTLEDDVKGVDLNGPCAVLILDPKKYEEPVVGVMTLTDAEKFKTTAVAQTQVVGKLGVIGENKDAVGEVAGALQDAKVTVIPTADMRDMVVATVDLPGLLARYKMDIQGFIQLAKLQLGGAGGMEDPAAKPDAMKKMGLKALEYLEKLLRETERQTGQLEVGLSSDDVGQVTGHVVFEAAPGSDVANFLAKNNRPTSAALAKFLPKDAYTTSVQAYDPASMADVTTGLTRIACDIAALTPEETAAITKLTTDWSRNLSGLQASAQTVAKDGQGTVQLLGINDPDVARATVKAMVGQTGAGTIGDFLKKYGVTVTLTEKHRTCKDIPVDKVEAVADMDKLLGALPLPGGNKARMKKELGKTLKAMMGAEDRVVCELVYGKKLLVIATGLDHEKTLEKVIDLMRTGGADGIGSDAEYLAAAARHPKDATTFGHFSLFGYSDVLAKMMGQMMGDMPMPPPNMFPTRAELPAVETPISFSMRMDGNKAVVYVHVPMKPIKEYAEAMKKKVKAMMEQMMRNARPPAVVPPEE